MSKHAPKEKQPTYVLRRDLKEIRESRGLRLDDVANQADISRNTLIAAEKGNPVGAETARSLATFYRLDFWAVLDHAVLPPATSKGILSWEVGAMGPVLTASNGIQWRVCDLKHRFVAGLRRRGKLYDLGQFTSNATMWERMQAHLSRHTEVCARVGDHPNIARSYDVFCDEDDRTHWWVLDEWLDGVTLAERVARGSLEGDELSRCMGDIASGIEALHRVGVIRRELSPRFVYVTKDKAVLTDFELAKLLDDSATVRPRGGWAKEDEQYRAPEIRDSDHPHRSWDFYSWGMILAYAASGREASGPADASGHIRDAGLPRDVRDFALSCIGRQANRPTDSSGVQEWFNSAGRR